MLTRNVDPERVWQTGAVADVERIGIDLRLEGDLAAMAAPIDFHACFLASI
jgi:hypothetical protein